MSRKLGGRQGERLLNLSCIASGFTHTLASAGSQMQPSPPRFSWKKGTRVISQSPNFWPNIVSPVHHHHHLFRQHHYHHHHPSPTWRTGAHLVIDGDTLLLARHGAALLVIDRGALLLVGCLALLLRCARAFSLCHCLLGGAFVLYCAGHTFGHRCHQRNSYIRFLL